LIRYQDQGLPLALRRIFINFYNTTQLAGLENYKARIDREPGETSAKSANLFPSRNPRNRKRGAVFQPFL
jgi:hypothetical protein